MQNGFGRVARAGAWAGSLIGALLFASAASAIPVSYAITTHSSPGFEASWLHTATGCNMASALDLNKNGQADVLHTCGDQYYAVTGEIHGEWDGTRLSALTGWIKDATIVGGGLGGAYYSASLQPLWTIVTDKWGTFVFEDLDGILNQITENTLALWGQNFYSYGVNEKCPGLSHCRAKGLYLYGTTAISEPQTLALLLIGMGAAAWTLRRKFASAPATDPLR